MARCLRSSERSLSPCRCRRPTHFTSPRSFSDSIAVAVSVFMSGNPGEKGRKLTKLPIFAACGPCPKSLLDDILTQRFLDAEMHAGRHGVQEVAGSNPVAPTSQGSPAQEVAVSLALCPPPVFALATF